MAMGIVSDKDFVVEKEKLTPSNETPVPTTAQIQDINRGRGAGNVEVPNPLRNVIGDELQTNGRESAVELARHFGISPSSVSAYGIGATSTASYADRPNGAVVKQARERIAKRARGKLIKALNKITDDKLEAANAKDLAGIAKDMSAVVRSMEPDDSKVPGQTNNGPTFVFYAPQVRSEDHFDVVHVKE
jgi:hypothetical protein